MTPGPIHGGAVKVLGAVGSVDRDGPVWVELELPSSFVDEVVVSAAQRQQVVEIGRAVVGPFDDVVDVAAVERDVAAGVAAGAVHGSQRAALGAVGDA